MYIALVGCSRFPELLEDDRLLFGPLRARGLVPEAVIWDAPEVDWSRYAIAVVRETWDYFLRPQEFAAWIDRVEPLVPLANSARVLRWNAHKRYLAELADRGLPVTPTAIVERIELLVALCERRGWSHVVVKPAISGGARLTRSFVRADLEGDGQRHLELVLAEGAALVQPYLRSLETEGERSYMFVDGELTHAVVRAATMGASAGPPDGTAIEPRPDEVEIARQLVAATPGELPLYARVDLATDERGVPVLQEIELIEPRMFFGASDRAAERMADAIAKRVR